MGKNVIIFGADMGSSGDIDNKNKDILSVVDGSAQGLDVTTLTTEAIYRFIKSIKRFVLSLQYKGSYLIC